MSADPAAPEGAAAPDARAPAPLDDRQTGVLLVSILIVALCAIVYELIIASISSYLLGDSVYQFSLTIGFFMFAMGIGSYISKYFTKDLIYSFVIVELSLALVGGVCGMALFFVFPLAPALFQFTQFAFIMAIGILVGLEIPLLTRAIAAGAGARRSIAHVLSFDYVGALFGSVAFPLLLLPNLGLLRASFAIGLINALVAVVNVMYLRRSLPHANALLIASLSVLALLIALTIAGARLTSYAQHHLYFDDILYREQSSYQNLVVTLDQRKKDLRLFIDGHLQFSELDEHRYHEALTHAVMRRPEGGPPIRSVLLMGGGDGLAARELLKHEGIERIDLVDLDPAMTRLGQEFAPLARLNQGALDDPRITIHNQDAFVFIRDPSGPRYDRVILDFPDPHNEALSKLYSVEFYTMLKRRMAPDGVVITQSSSPFFARRTFWSITTTLEAAFPTVEPMQISIPSFGVWGFNIAYAGAPLGAAPIAAATRFLDGPTLAAARVFPRDLARPDDVVANSIFEPSLYQTYLADLAERAATAPAPPELRP